MTIATELAERISAMSYDMLPPEVLHWAKVGLLDTVGVILAGVDEECTRIVSRVNALSLGPALLFGSARTTNPLEAALVNGTAAHALDFDDSSSSLAGHPSAPILPALFALADTGRVNGRDFLTAYVAGFETETRLAHAVNFYHFEKGWHPTSTLGTFGCAAACARLLKMPPEQIAMALAVAASLAFGIKANFGTMTKPLHIGHCARNGLMAALLAREGFTASLDAIENRQGFFMVFNGKGNFDADRVLSNWGAPFEIVQPGINIKQYPCCASTLSAVDVMIALVEEHGVRPEMVERVDSWTHPQRLANVNRPNPCSALDAKFSMQYCLARSLTSGKVVLADFEGDAYVDPAIRAIMSRIYAAPHPQISMDSSEYLAAEVRLHMRDGRILSQSTDRALGFGSEKPLPTARLEAKFLDCAGRVLDDALARKLLELLWHWDELDDVSVSRELLAGSSRMSRALSMKEGVTGH